MKAFIDSGVPVMLTVKVPPEVAGKLATLADDKSVTVADVVLGLIMHETSGARFKKHKSKRAPVRPGRVSLAELVEAGCTPEQIAKHRHISMESAMEAIQRVTREGI